MLSQERVEGNDFITNIRPVYGFGKAMETGDMTGVLSYTDVYQLVQQEIQQPSNPLEHVAGRIGKRLLVEFPLIRIIDLELAKVNPPMDADYDGVGVEIHLVNEKID